VNPAIPARILWEGGFVVMIRRRVPARGGGFFVVVFGIFIIIRIIIALAVVVTAAAAALVIVDAVTVGNIRHVFLFVFVVVRGRFGIVFFLGAFPVERRWALGG
jgi:hypothetical protein